MKPDLGLRCQVFGSVRCTVDLLLGCAELEVVAGEGTLFRPSCWGIEEIVRALDACSLRRDRLARDQEAALEWARGQITMPPGRRISDPGEVRRRSRWRRNRAKAAADG